MCKCVVFPYVITLSRLVTKYYSKYMQELSIDNEG